ncbi:MAG: fibronectin type III domain-containing protein [Deltaproteobacteria bacterium]|nr:fibronectin type III domain-containing protein [Deltaproteobacteria bacterium]
MRAPSCLAAAAATSCLAIAACSTERAPLSDDPRPTWETIESGFAVGCGGDSCHVRTPGAGPPAAQLDLSPGIAYRQLLGPSCIGLPSGQDFRDEPSPLLVARGDPDASYLVCKLDPDCSDIAPGTTHMPPVAGVTDPAMLARVRAWITDGALGPADPEGDGCTAPPAFDGVTGATATAPGTIELTWAPAYDPRGAEAIGYRAYVGTTSGHANFLRPRLDLPPGDRTPRTGGTVTGLAPGWTYFVVVRAYSLDGGEDGNRAEVTVSLGDTVAPEFAGFETLTPQADGTLRLTWSPGNDDADPSSRLRYLVLFSSVPGAYDTSAPAFVTDPGALEAVVATPSGAGYVTVRARDGAGNVSGPSREEALSSSDRTPPAFAGATSATASPGAATIRWDPAIDDTSAASEIVYLVYSGADVEGALASEPIVTPPGVTSAAVGRLAVSTTYTFVVRARDLAGNIDGNTVAVTATTPATADTTAPTFAGASSATSISGGVRLSWTAATDDTAAPSDIQYLVWQSATSGGAMLAGAPTYTTALGASSFDVLGLGDGTYFFVVRAQDPAGNLDGNTVEVSGAPIRDTTAPTFAGLATATAASPTAVSLSWSAATDDATPASGITYLVHHTMGAGPVDTTTPSATTAPGATSFVVTGLTTGADYSFVVRARDAAGNVDSNTAQRTVSLADSTAPVFAGATSARAVGSTSIELSWTAANDDATPASSIVYLVYQATSAGAESFATPSVTTPAGVTGAMITGLSPDTAYFFVVRARDAAGNVDANTREVTARTSTPFVVSFARDVQPILTAECASAGCHTGIRPAADCALDASRSYAALVNVTSTSCPPSDRVVPGDTGASFLWAKLTGIGICAGGGTQMPKSGMALPSAQLEIIRAWIEAGARND